MIKNPSGISFGERAPFDQDETPQHPNENICCCRFHFVPVFIHSLSQSCLGLDDNDNTHSTLTTAKTPRLGMCHTTR